MKTVTYAFSGKPVNYHIGESLSHLDRYADPARSVLIVDENVARLHGTKLGRWRKIMVPGQEDSKSLRMLGQVVEQLIDMEADRSTLIVGVGGGVVTDLTGFVAAVYMRGVRCAFVPTTLLAQVDASIGGKNGIDFGRFKNMLGVIRQPEFLLLDPEVLDTLPEDEWRHGFAEIIKYACICDEGMFTFLESSPEKALARERETMSRLIEQSLTIKSDIVQQDEFEQNQRRWLNFGHTIGHAVERLESIAHGQAVAKGMVAAAALSRALAGLPAAEEARIADLIRRYQLPTGITADAAAISGLFAMDKKRENDHIHFVLLDRIGHALTQPVPLDQLSVLLEEQLKTPSKNY